MRLDLSTSSLKHKKLGNMFCSLIYWDNSYLLEKPCLNFDWFSKEFFSNSYDYNSSSLQSMLKYMIDFTLA